MQGGDSAVDFIISWLPGLLRRSILCLRSRCKCEALDRTVQDLKFRHIIAIAPEPFIETVDHVGGAGLARALFWCSLLALD